MQLPADCIQESSKYRQTRAPDEQTSHGLRGVLPVAALSKYCQENHPCSTVRTQSGYPTTTQRRMVQLLERPSNNHRPYRREENGSTETEIRNGTFTEANHEYVIESQCQMVATKSMSTLMLKCMKLEKTLVSRYDDAGGNTRITVIKRNNHENRHNADGTHGLSYATARPAPFERRWMLQKSDDEGLGEWSSSTHCTAAEDYFKDMSCHSKEAIPPTQHMA